MRTKQAFTLVELLVVTAVVGILAALLFPVLGRAKGKARSTVCLSNLRQWGVATHLYAAENRGHLPRDGFASPTLPEHFKSGWYVQLPEMIGVSAYRDAAWRTNPVVNPGNSAWICPSNPRRCDSSSRTNILFHYCVNGLVNGTGNPDRPIRVGSLRESSALVYMCDNKNVPAVHANRNKPGGFAHTNLHNEGAQFLFLDGHAARFKSGAYWDFTVDRPFTNNPDLVWLPR